MNTVKRTAIINRIKNAVRAFRGRPIQSISFGLDVKRCDRCDYKRDQGLRDNLLVTTGTRAAYMEEHGFINLPHGIDGESRFATFAVRIVDRYLYRRSNEDINFDEYIETALLEEYLC